MFCFVAVIVVFGSAFLVHIVGYVLRILNHYFLRSFVCLLLTVCWIESIWTYSTEPQRYLNVSQTTQLWYHHAMRSIARWKCYQIQLFCLNVVVVCIL